MLMQVLKIVKEAHRRNLNHQHNSTHLTLTFITLACHSTLIERLMLLTDVREAKTLKEAVKIVCLLLEI